MGASLLLGKVTSTLANATELAVCSCKFVVRHHHCHHGGLGLVEPHLTIAGLPGGCIQGGLQTKLQFGTKYRLPCAILAAIRRIAVLRIDAKDHDGLLAAESPLTRADAKLLYWLVCISGSREIVYTMCEHVQQHWLIEYLHCCQAQRQHIAK